MLTVLISNSSIAISKALLNRILDHVLNNHGKRIHPYPTTFRIVENMEIMLSIHGGCFH